MQRSRLRVLARYRRMRAREPARRSASLVVLCAIAALQVVSAGLPADPVRAQIPLPTPAAEPEAPAPDPAARIEAVREEIATRVAALGGDAAGDPQIAALRRLVDVLQRAQEARRVSDQLARWQEEARARAARPPSTYFKTEPPFAVPLLDAVFLSWEAQRTQRERLAAVVADTREALEAAREAFAEAERRRRRASEAREQADTATEEARLLAALRERELESRIARARLEVAEVALENAQLEEAVQRQAEEQAAAALDWVRAHLLPDDAHLREMLAELEKRRFDLERELEATRLDLADAAGRLETVRARPGPESVEAAAAHAAEVAAHRLAFTTTQRRVALLGERAQRLDLAQETWRRRYAVLAGELDAETAGRWRSDAEAQIEELRRQRRIKEARLAELRTDLDALRDRIAAAIAGEAGGAAPAEAGAPAAADPAAREETLRWLRAQERDLVALTQLYETDLAHLTEVVRLEARLIDELAVHDAGLPLDERIARLWSRLEAVWAWEITASEDRPITVGKVLTALVVFAFGMLLGRRLAVWVGSRVLSRFGFDAGVRSAFESLFFYALVALTFLVALRTVNIPLTAFAVVGGALALGIGFGSQAVVSNFISGLILLAERPIKPGDHIEVEGIYGVVERIGLRSTRIRTGDNFHIIVPNASFLERSVINWTHDTNVVRLRIPVGVAYGSAIRTVERALVDVARAHTATLESPEPIALFRDFADSALLFEVRFWIRIRDIGDRLAIESEVRFAIDERFREEGVVIAFPQRDLHIDASRPFPVRIERDADA